MSEKLLNDTGVNGLLFWFLTRGEARPDKRRGILLYEQ